ncbi:Hamartin protein-domain-containing protein [Gautieria morchelliformis]|nr:Hamartin protein-domain-containing protein [Gautieria morchelliformis]
MSLDSDISRRIRAVLDSDSPTKYLSELVTAIDAFVQQHRDQEIAVLDQMQNEVESMYKELVDHSSSKNVEAFVSILHAFLPVFQPLHIITCWWDLVLRPALRDPRLSAKALQQVKVIALHGLIPDSSKAPEFRKRIIELFILDVHDEVSRRDALEHAAMSPNERRIQQLWKHNLGDILEDFYVQRPEEFLNAVDVFFRSSQRRLKLSVLLGTVVRSAEFRANEFARHPLLDALLLSLMVDGSSTLLEIEVATLVCLLRQFAIHAPDTLARILPLCYAILARLICWRPRFEPPNLWEREGNISDTSQSRVSDVDLDATQTSPIRPDVGWERLDATFTSSLSDPPSPLALFRTLYGLYPCNTLTFLRDPVDYLNNAALKSPFVADWPDIVDEDQIRTRSRALLRQNILHSSLLTQTAESELAQHDRWAGWDLPRIVMMCTMLDVRNTALSLGRPPDPPQVQIPDSDHSTLEALELRPPSSLKATSPLGDNAVDIELRNTEYSISERPKVSIQDILATYHVLKSGIEIDVVDPTPTWPHMLIRSTVASSASGAEPTLRASSSSGSDDAIPPYVEKAIAGLQRENLLLRTELSYELWLKRENVKRIGRLYEDRILVKGAEVERQSLHNKLREYKGQVQRLQDALTKEQAGAAATKAQHADYTGRLQARLRAEKAEKQAWANEKLELKSACEDAKAMLEAQARRLSDATESVFKLETEIKENAPKVARLRDYEDKINQLTKTQQLWDDDVRRYKEQAAYLEDLRGRYKNKLLLIESYENANRELEETILSLRGRISSLESETAHHRPPEPSAAVFKMMETLRDQVSKLTAERDILINQNDELGCQLEDLRVRMETLQGHSRSAEGRGPWWVIESVEQASSHIRATCL